MEVWVPSDWTGADWTINTWPGPRPFVNLAPHKSDWRVFPTGECHLNHEDKQKASDRLVRTGSSPRLSRRLDWKTATRVLHYRSGAVRWVRESCTQARLVRRSLLSAGLTARACLKGTITCCQSRIYARLASVHRVCLPTLEDWSLTQQGHTPPFRECVLLQLCKDDPTCMFCLPGCKGSTFWACIMTSPVVIDFWSL